MSPNSFYAWVDQENKSILIEALERKTDAVRRLKTIVVVNRIETDKHHPYSLDKPVK